MTLVVGVGTSTGAAPAEVSALVDEALAAAGLALSDVVAIATIVSKLGDRAIATLGWPVLAYTPDELNAVSVPHPSARAKCATGTPSVAEAAALLGAGVGAELVVAKRVSAHATVAVARGSAALAFSQIAEPKERAVPHPFLSDEWLDEAKAIREKYAGQGTPMGHKIKMNQVITEVPFGPAELQLYMDTTSGDIVMEKGALPDADVTVTTDYETARKIFVDQDPQAGMQAFMSGKIKVQGDMMKLMQMQGTAPDETAKKVADEIKEITA